LTDSSLDINATFRGGGRAVEFLDEINQASIVMLDEPTWRGFWFLSIANRQLAITAFELS